MAVSATSRLARLLAGMAFAVGLTAACGGADDPAAAGPDIEGDWQLSHGTADGVAIPIVDGHRPTLTIENAEWGGTVCNHYGATATRSGDDVRLDDLFQTEMGCVDDGVMESEAAYLDAFRRVTRVEVVAGRLVLRGDDAELVYTEVAPEPDAPLVGTTWQLESLVHGDGPDGAVSQAMTPAELVLREDGSMRASTGCRSLGGPYHLDGDLLDLTQVGGDGHECEDPDRAAQDEHVQATLLGGTGIRVSIEGSRLQLTAPSGRGLHYRAT